MYVYIVCVYVGTYRYVVTLFEKYIHTYRTRIKFRG